MDAPPTESPNRPLMKIVVRRSHLPALIAAAWIVLDLILLAASFVPKTSEPTDWWLTIVLAFVFAQLSYGGLWGAFGPGQAAIRIPLILGSTALGIAGFFRQLVFLNELELWFLGFFLILLLLYQGVVVALGVLLQKILGWRIVWQGESSLQSATQFGVRDILYWMAGVGVLITLFRFTFGAVSFSTLYAGNLGEDIVIAVVVLASILAQTCLAGWAAFPAQQTSYRWLIGLIACPLVALFCGAPIAVGWGGQQYLIVTTLLILQYVVLWSQLALLHWQGLRLIDESSFP